jgi:hypothetical protein
MKNFKLKSPGQLRKVRNKLNQEDVYYTYSNWEIKEIDGVKFLPVVKQSNHKATQQIHYMKKDNMEYVR